MKKLIVAAIAGVFCACPVYADDFTAEQAKELDAIASQMLQNKDDAAKLDFLMQKNTCVEKAKDLEGLNACLTRFSADKVKDMTK